MLSCEGNCSNEKSADRRRRIRLDSCVLLREIPTRMLDLVRVSTIKIGYLTVFHQRKHTQENEEKERRRWKRNFEAH